MTLPGMAGLVALTLIVALAPASLALAENVVDCTTQTGLQEAFQVTAPETEVKVKCKPDGNVKPAPLPDGKLTKVFSDAKCANEVDLTSVCPGATATVDTSQKIVTISIKALPQAEQTFYVECTTSGRTKCIAQVSVKEAAPAGPGAVGQPQGGGAGVQICKQGTTSITVSVPDKGSSVQFACEGELTLYPVDAKKVFSEDCKKQEDLKDMTRTQAAGVAVSTVFTLTADKKPPKKRLCYLCARKGITDVNKGSAADYCMVYVESSARTQFGLGLTLALMLPCVLTALHFT